jgi:hypothetical protein
LVRLLCLANKLYFALGNTRGEVLIRDRIASFPIVSESVAPGGIGFSHFVAPEKVSYSFVLSMQAYSNELLFVGLSQAKEDPE